ncbi:MAG TPA: ABC transporter permease [Trueperaceae bacterium]|nr:ABC transporter permease [Trueperaceae bacterium]
MTSLLRMELGKVLRLGSVRFSLVLVVLFPLLWAYAPGIYKVYDFYLVSAYQVPALSLLSSMRFLLPLLVAISAAELLGVEIANGTLQTVLLRPVTRSQWLLSKLLIVTVYPFAVLAVFLLVSLLAGAPYGYGSFVGGTGLGQAGLLGQGTMAAGQAVGEVLRAYLVAGYSLVPVALLSMLLTVVFMNAAGGALATLSVLIFMQLLVVFPALTPYLLTTQLDAYAKPVSNLGWMLALIALYAAAFAAASVVLFERKDF